MLARAKIIISGLVQGVLFRENFKKQAQARGLVGFVRNISSGQVEALVEGDQQQIDSLVRWARLGTPPAKVNNLEIEAEDYKGEFAGFAIK